ncbi:MAG: BlaI/MecI/CopY family transcriptional regulator [Candidatus Omnitrophica bacterium]|nr:BlaI/MecI/CopY family transcriptional regulator [Candidatus Omnitrophota bacterium]
MAQYPRISEAEWEILKALWKRAHQTANELAERLAPKNDWSPRTVRTRINRLFAKGALKRVKRGRAFQFKPRVQESECVLAATESFLDRVFDGHLNPMVAHLVEHKKLTRRQIDELKRILDEEG